MDYRRLGRSGLKVSPLCLGAMNFGDQTDEATAARIIGNARDRGINFIDTANAYSAGRSEEIVGRAIKADRDHWVLATKIANPMGPGPNDRGLSRAAVARAVDGCFRRLGVEAIDILYLHKEDASTPLEETVSAMCDLLRSGKVRYFGVSNFRSWRLAELCRLCDQHGIDRPVVSQPCYNVLNRTVEVEHLPACAHYGLGVVPYSPLARGVLSGKYRPGAAPPPASRAARGDKRMMQTEWRPESLAIAMEIAEHAKARGLELGQFAIAWLLRNTLVTSPVVGPRTDEQWAQYVSALDVHLTDDDERLIDRLVTTGHASTPGYNDPAYPIEGRVVG